MVQFYLSKLNPSEDLQRCRESQRLRRPMAIAGTSEAGKVELFTGVVQAIEDDPKREPSRRFRITMADPD